MTYASGTGAAITPVEIKRIEGVFKCRGCEEPKMTEHLTAFNGLGSNKPCDFRRAK